MVLEMRAAVRGSPLALGQPAELPLRVPTADHDVPVWVCGHIGSGSLAHRVWVPGSSGPVPVQVPVLYPHTAYTPLLARGVFSVRVSCAVCARSGEVPVLVAPTALPGAFSCGAWTRG